MIKLLPLDFLDVSHRILWKNENTDYHLQISAVVPQISKFEKCVTMSVSWKTRIEDRGSSEKKTNNKITPGLHLACTTLAVTFVYLYCKICFKSLSTCFLGAKYKTFRECFSYLHYILWRRARLSFEPFASSR